MFELLGIRVIEWFLLELISQASTGIQNILKFSGYSSYLKSNQSNLSNQETCITGIWSTILLPYNIWLCVKIRLL